MASGLPLPASKSSRSLQPFNGRRPNNVCSELVVKLVNMQDMNRVRYLREQSKAVKHLSFHSSGLYIAVSCSDGVLYVYSLSKEEPELLKKVDGLIRRLETDAEASSKVVWHPDGRAFAAPTATRSTSVHSCLRATSAHMRSRCASHVLGGLGAATSVHQRTHGGRYCHGMVTEWSTTRDRWFRRKDLTLGC